MQELINELVARQLVYGFLGRAFYEPPTVEFIQPLVDEALFDDWPLDGKDWRTQEGLAELRAFCANWEIEQIDRLERDFARLFVGPDRLLAPPWESVYRSEERLIFERQTLEVRALYKHYGMPVPRPYVEPEDHLGLEFGFVAYLCALALDAIRTDRLDLLDIILKALNDFDAQHLSQWADECLTLVMTHAETAYYRGVARLARGSLQETRAPLSIGIEFAAQ